MAKDNSPVPYTCSIIDEVIDHLNSIDAEEPDAIHGIVYRAKISLEDIRKANQELRDWGNEMYRERNEFEKDYNDSRKEVKSLEVAQIQRNGRRKKILTKPRMLILR